MARILRVENALTLLLVFIPIALLFEYMLHPGGTWIFLAASVAIIPLAGLMGKSTEALAARVGAGLGGLLNATFGNAAELIIAFFALRAGLFDLVKASLTGSIIGNVLLVFGLAALLGGLRYPRQRFNSTAAGVGSTMLLLSAIALIIPAVYHGIVGPAAPGGERMLSLEIAVVLMATYLLSLVFSLKTHSHLYAGTGAVPPEVAAADAAAETTAAPAPRASEAAKAAERAEAAETADEHGDPAWSARRALTVLVVSAALVGWMSELLVGALEEAAATLGMNEVFVGVIVVATVGNAAEHSTAVLVALKDKMDLSIQIAVGSSVQIALFVAPLLVFLSYFVGPAPMDLRFTALEVVAVVLAVLSISQIAHDGETHWMEGVQLLAVYLILALAFFFVPA